MNVRISSPRILRLLALAAVAMLGATTTPGQVTITWLGGSASWNTGGNWIGGLLPGLADTAQITTGTATVDSNVSITTLLFSGGSIGGTATLTLTGTGSTWSGGNMNSAGTLAIASGATFAISGSTHDFNQHTITNAGTVTWSGGDLRTGNGGSFTNSGTFTDTAASSSTAAFLGNVFGGTTSFTNSGTYNKNANGNATSGTTTISTPFANTGTVNVNAGTLTFNGGGSNASGAKINVASGAGLNFSAGSFTIASATDIVDAGGAYAVSGGTVTVSAGSGTVSTLNLSGGSLDFTSGGLTLSNLTVNSGTLGSGTYTTAVLTQSGGALTTGTLVLTGTGSTWSNGNMNGTGSITIQSGASLAITGGTHDFNQHTITNAGTIAWSGGDLRTGNGGSFTNSGTFTDTAASSSTAAFLGNVFGGTTSFTNNGTYNKNANGNATSGTTTISTPFSNTGTVNLNAGTLAFANGGSNASSAKLNVASGAGLNFSGGNFTIASATDIVDAGGIYTFSGANVAVTAGTVTLPGITLTGGSLGFTAGGLTLTTLNVSGGSLDAGTYSAVTLAQSGGALTTGALTLSGTSSTWTGGTMNGTGSLTLASGAALAISGSTHDFNQHTVANSGTVSWSGGDLRTGNGGSFTNHGTFTDTSASSSTSTFFGNVFGGTAGSFVNNGTYNKNAHSNTTAGTTTIGMPFTNNGAVNVNAGTLALTAGGSATTAGTFTVGAGNLLNFSGGTYTLANGASLTGTGTIALTGGSLAVASGTASLANLSLSGGSLDGAGNAAIPAFTQTGGNIGISSLSLTGTINWTSGSWNSSAPSTATIASGKTLTISDTVNNGRDFNFRTITNNGTVNWNSAYLRSGNGGGFVNAAGGTFNDFNASSYTIYNNYGGTYVFTNDGTYTRHAAGTTYFDTTFNNNGTLNLAQGDIQIRQGGTMGASSVVNAASGTHLYFTNNYTLLDGAQFTGAGFVAQLGGTLSINGTLLASAVTWQGGNWNAASNSGLVSTIAASTTLNLSDASDNIRDFHGRGIVNNGTVNWNSAYLRGGNGSSFTNAAGATFNDLNPSGYSIYNPYGGSFVFTNNGTYVRNAAGTTFIDTTFDNQGVINVLKGDLQFRQGGTLGSTGSINASSGTNVFFTNNYSVANGSSLLGAGNYWLTGGTFAITGQINVTNFRQTGGAVTGTHTINGTYHWSGGNWSSSGTTTIAATGTVNLADSGDAYRDFNGRTVVNQGIVNWGAGYLRGGNSATFTNAAGATFNDLNASGYSIYNPFGGSYAFVNNGTYIRNAGNTTYFDTTFNNNGTLSLLQGDIRLRQGGTMGATSVATAANGTHLYFQNDYTLLDGAQFTGAGLFNQIAGTLTVNGSLKADSFLWSGGNWNASGAPPTTTIAASTILNLTDGSDQYRDFNDRAIVNQGTVNWSSGFLRSGNGGSFTNSAIFNDTNGSGYSIYNPYGGSFVFTNNGTYNRNAGNTTYFDTTFNNNGTINLQQGDIRLRQGGTMSATSLVNGSAGTHLYFQNDYTLASGSQFVGLGLFNQIGGTLTINGSLTASSFLWSGGNWNAATNSGLVSTIAAGTILNLSDANDQYRDFYGRGILNSGIVNWSSGFLRSGGGGTFTNAATFNDLNTAGYSIYNPYGGSFAFVNNGTYSRNVGGVTYFDTTFNNNGTLNLQQGDIRLRQGGTMSATSLVNTSAGAHLYFQNDYTLTDGAQFLGSGLVAQIGGTLTANGNLRATSFSWQGGNWNAASNSGLVTTIAAGSVLNLSDASDQYRDFNGRGIVNNGTVNWSSGYLRSGNGGTFLNQIGGVFNDQNTAGYSMHNPFGGTFTFTNNGTYLHAVGGTSFIAVPFINNNGAILVSGGTLRFQSSFQQNSGTVAVANGASLQFDNGFALAAGILTGTGTVVGDVSSYGLISPGTTTGTLNISGNLTLLSTSALLIELGGTTQGSGYDFLNVSGTATLGGTLSLKFTGSFASTVSSTDTFTILNASSQVGSFVNVPTGTRLVTSDGLGSFQVNYSANSVTLSSFVAIPEPSTYALLAAGLMLLAGSALHRRRRR